MSGHSDEDPAAALRKSFYSKFAKLTLRQQPKLKIVNEESPEKSGRLPAWPTGPQSERYANEQLEYTVPYRALYEVSSSSTICEDFEADGSAKSAQDDAKSQISEDPEDRTETASVLSSYNKSFKNHIPLNMRGRKFMNKSILTTPSVVNFEQVSTIQAPTEFASGAEYTSNIRVEDVRKDFFKNFKTCDKLPISSQKSYLVNSINSYSVVIIEGSTGCGKTTQVPIYILEDAIKRPQSDKAPLIYVTQPRRIAARSIAQRVCDEHGWQVGTIVGYQVGLDKQVGPQTTLVFCTAGVLLQKLIQEKSLANYTHIMIDEAHERDTDTDLLLMMIRTIMRKENSYFRLIVMSATMDMSKLKTYFTFKTTYGHKGLKTPSIVKIDGKEPNEIQVIYYDQLDRNFQLKVKTPSFDITCAELHDECLEAAKKLIVEVIPNLDSFNSLSESTLVFLPGLAEICKLHRMLRDYEHILDIIPLHSTISHAEQVKAFLRPRDGCRKVILATNIAESSITVRDVGFIIDFCLTKVLRKHSVTNFPALRLQWSTVDKSIQRAGRTGRCCPGKVFRMVSLPFFQQFQQYAEPELLTSPLELSVLRLKNFQMGEVKALLAIVLDPPPFNEIRTAILELKQIGALSSTYEGKITDIDGDLTELGKIISNLPIDVRLGKLLVMASLFDVLEPAIVVAACLSTNRTVVRNLFEDRLKTYSSKLDWARGSDSDLIVSLEVYKEYKIFKEKADRSQISLEKFCNNKNLDEKKLHEVSTLVMELTSRLHDINIRLYNQPNRIRDHHQDELMLKIAFCTAFYPNYFLTEDMDVLEIQRALGSFDPAKTVLLHNFPQNHVPLYKTQIMTQLSDFGLGEDVDYVAEVSRALLVFNDEKDMLEDTSSKVAIRTEGIIETNQPAKRAVYHALKIAEWDRRFVIWEFKTEEALDRMHFYNRQINDLRDRATGKLLPSWMRLVDGPADNSRLIELQDDAYYDYICQNHFIEIEFNRAQDEEDTDHLEELKYKIHEQRMNRTYDDNDSVISYGVYKPDVKTIKGPTSPIQMSFRSVLERSKGYKVDIDSVSVNSILLNPDYQKPRRQMMVAASVAQSKRNRIVACDTTLMPNIYGFPTIMSLLFAQYYRLVSNEKSKCITGGIFGLGWADNEQPIDKSYEVELSFDVHITKNDIDLINEARKTISKLLKFTDVSDAGGPRFELQERLREIIMAIIRKRRCPIEEVSLADINWSDPECFYFKDKHNVPREQLSRLEEGQTRNFLPIIEVTKNYTEQDMFEAIRENLDYLERVERCEVAIPIGGVYCYLCGFGRENIYLIQSKLVQHVYSDSHRLKLEEFEKGEERARINMARE